MQFFKDLDGLAQQDHVLLSIGPAYLSGKDGDAQADLLAEILQNTKSIDGSVFVTKDDNVNWPAVKPPLASSRSSRTQRPTAKAISASPPSPAFLPTRRFSQRPITLATATS